MSAQGWVGKNLVIALDGQPIAAVRAKSVHYAAQPIDITDGESNGFRRILEVADSFSVEVEVEGVATIDNYAVLRDHWYGETLSDVEIIHPDGTTESPVDGAFLSSLSSSGEHAGAVSFQARFSFSGALTSNRVAPVLNATQYRDNIVLVWSAATLPDLPVDSYDIYRRINDGAFALLDSVAGDVVTYSDTDTGALIDGDVVEYYVVANGQTGSTVESNRDAVTWEALAELEFTEPGATPWIKPANLDYIVVTLIAGGGGGGSGRRGYVNATNGGAGGGGGGKSQYTIPAASLSAIETITVGGGGLGAPGSSSSTSGTQDGVKGDNGGDTSFGAHGTATGGKGGAGGNQGSTAPTSSTPARGLGGTGNVANGGDGGYSNGNSGGSFAGQNSQAGPGGGSGGGRSIQFANDIDATAGGTGDTSGENNAGGIGGGRAVDGTPGTDSATNKAGGGGGGGGGNTWISDPVTSGPAGGAGARGGRYGAGGGGGGCGQSQNNAGSGGFSLIQSGEGGDGAPGHVLVEYFYL